MFRNFFTPATKVDVWMDSKVNLRHEEEACLASVRGLVDGIVIGFVIGGALGILQGWLYDSKTKDMCMVSGSWALNGAAIGAIVLTLSHTILQADFTPGFYAVR